MKKINLIGAVAASALMVFQSCAGTLDVTNPNSLNDDQIRELLASSDETKVNATLAAIGSGLEAYVCLNNATLSGGFTNNYSNEFSINLFRNLGCEDIVFGINGISTTDGWAAYYAHQFNPAQNDQNASNYGWWYSSSYIIAQANKSATYLTDEVASAPTALPAVKTYAAQAKTLRAWGYLQLMERFRKAYAYGGKEEQGMPIYTVYAYNTPVAPKTADETWAWIISELEGANKYFAEGTNSATDGFTTVKDPYTDTSLYDIDRTFSEYLLARACLDCGQYAKAVEACQRLLAKYPDFIAEANYGVDTKDLDDIATTTSADWSTGKKEVNNDDNAFLSAKCNPEALFGWTSDANCYQWSFLNSLQPANANTGLFQISENLYIQIDDNDYRKARFADHSIAEFPYFSTNGHAATEMPKYTNLKFGATIQQGQTVRKIVSGTTGSDMIYLRSSEVWLMLAEAQYKNNDETGAKATLNKLLAARTVAGKPALTCDTYKGNLSTMDLIKLQWRIEMWGEGGLNYYCKKRWNEASTRTSSNHWNKTGWSVDDMEWQIPLKELSTNSNWTR